MVVLISIVFEEESGFLSDELDMGDGGVEAGAFFALNAEKMPLSIKGTGFAVVADDSNDLGHVPGYGLQGDTHGHGLPCRRHLFDGLGGLLANGTPGIEGGQLLETVPVDGVSAGHLVTGLAAAEKVLLADGAVGHIFSGFAVVVMEA